jgi:hypothetical protein
MCGGGSVTISNQMGLGGGIVRLALTTVDGMVKTLD